MMSAARDQPSRRAGPEISGYPTRNAPRRAESVASERELKETHRVTVPLQAMHESVSHDPADSAARRSPGGECNQGGIEFRWAFDDTVIGTHCS
jgi:hypothetical protein